MFKEHLHTSKNDFIGAWYLEDNSVCDLLIDFFYKNENYWHLGTLGPEKDLNKKRKDSIDLEVSKFGNIEPLSNYLNELSKVTDEYKLKYERCDLGHQEWGIYEAWNIQKYPPGGGYHEYHFERGYWTIHRHLVFMTFLNDVTEEGGETEWLYQKTKIKPEKGLTVIWPAEWPWTHRGVMCKNQSKYIATGWYSYRNN